MVLSKKEEILGVEVKSYSLKEILTKTVVELLILEFTWKKKKTSHKALIETVAHSKRQYEVRDTNTLVLDRNRKLKGKECGLWYKVQQAAYFNI